MIEQLRDMWVQFRRYPQWGNFELDYRIIRANAKVVL